MTRRKSIHDIHPQIDGDDGALFDLAPLGVLATLVGIVAFIGWLIWG